MGKIKTVLALLCKCFANVVMWFWFTFVWLYLSGEIMSLFYKTSDEINWMNSLRLIIILITYCFPVYYFGFKWLAPAVKNIWEIYDIIKNRKKTTGELG